MPRRGPPVRRAARLLRHGSILAVSLASCSEPGSQTGGTYRGRVDLVPIYPAEASIATTALAIDAARIRIVRPPQTVLLDSTAAFPAASDQLSLDLTVQLIARTERLAARLELSGGGQVLFAGEDTITVTAEGSGPAATPQIHLSYVGPGANLASLLLEPRDTTLTLGSQFQFRTTGMDANEGAVSQYYARWSTADLGVKVSPTGLLTAPSARGQTVLRVVTANGVSDSTTVRFAPPAAALVITSGDGQTGAAGTPLPQPLTVQVKAADNGGVPGVGVDFAGVGGSTVRDPFVVTDANGNASTVGTLGLALGAQSFTASVTGLTTVRFSATASAGPVAQLFVVSGSGQTGTVDNALTAPLVVGAIDAQQNPTPNTTVDWTVVSGGGVLTSSSSVTDLSGHAQIGYKLGVTAGANLVSAQARGAGAVPAVQFTATGLPGQAAFLAAESGIGQSVAVGQTATARISLTVEDSLGNPVPGTKVDWQVVLGGGSVSTATTRSDGLGVGGVRYTAGSQAAVNLIRASIQGGPPGSTYLVSVRSTAGPTASFSRFSGDNQDVAGGGAFSQPLIVALTDLFDNPVPASSVGWSVTFGTLSATATQTDDHGLTSVIYQSGAQQHSDLVTPFNVTGQTTFVINDSSTARAVRPVGGDNQTAAAGSPLPLALRVLVTDLGTPAPGVAVTFSVLSGGGTLSAPTAITNALGIASVNLRLGSRAGPNIVQATEPTNFKTVELGATAVAGSPAFIVPTAGDFRTGSLAAGFSPVLSVVVTDASGNPATGVQINWSDQSGGSLLPASSTTNSQGMASTAYLPTTTGRQRVRATVGTSSTVYDFVVIVLP